jgi:polyferredoxin
MKQKWYEYLWLVELLYWVLGLCNILFAWLGMLFFVLPLLVAILAGNKAYCNRYCGRGQLFELLGSKLKLSANRRPPRFLRSRWFRYGFLIFFMTMFCLMLFSTYKVFVGAPLRQTVTLLWTFKLPWHWAQVDMVAPWIAQFAFGFFGVMMTSTVLGLLTMLFFRPRSWCVYCPMGTMTQTICQFKHRKEVSCLGGESGKNCRASEAVGE